MININRSQNPSTQLTRIKVVLLTVSIHQLLLSVEISNNIYSIERRRIILTAVFNYISFIIFIKSGAELCYLQIFQFYYRQGLVPQPSQSEPPESHPTSNDEQEEPDSTAPAPPADPDDTDEQRLEHAQTLYQNRQSAAYACYAAPRLSDQLDKSKCRMIAWECNICLGDINRPANDRSCSNLLTHAG
ncbi:hypothetical protein Pst134EA_022955 [Puccinia striiformis f. sp. tritici]|uniref:hypothetical protein n=1 Tax=Puccinia striiformis f. sp. tritici TaxID=168172 RepID=UPI002008A0E7|nr:hypothetical protein Pst134EA_022955 [Puccinia striiformis f. sp. tritici]KAH9455492.1 hypothetical protein Pst134EA_022955 [Puccinia striiformis f. sp. tritici]